MEFSELMKAERKAQRVTLRSLSAKSGVEFYRLADFDAGRAEPYGEEKDRICKVLGIYHQDMTQKHLGKFKGTGKPCWHSRQSKDGKLIYWPGYHADHTPQELYYECQSILSDLVRNHPEVVKNIKRRT